MAARPNESRWDERGHARPHSRNPQDRDPFAGAQTELFCEIREVTKPHTGYGEIPIVSLFPGTPQTLNCTLSEVVETHAGIDENVVEPPILV